MWVINIHYHFKLHLNKQHLAKHLNLEYILQALFSGEPLVILHTFQQCISSVRWVDGRLFGLCHFIYIFM